MYLECNNITKIYNNNYIINNISINVKEGEVVGLLGPNGSGKTTTFHIVIGILKANKGSIILNKENITTYPMHLRIKKGIGYLSQESSIFRKLSVEDNIMCVLEMTTLSNNEKFNMKEKLLNKFNLKNIRNRYGYLLSGGERRRTEIARCLAIKPKFILLDEPFSGIDPIAVESIQNIIFSLKKNNIGILITDHNVQETLSITDRTYLIFDGNIIKHGTSEQLSNDHLARDIYFGKNFKLKSIK